MKKPKKRPSKTAKAAQKLLSESQMLSDSKSNTTSGSEFQAELPTPRTNVKAIKPRPDKKPRLMRKDELRKFWLSKRRELSDEDVARLSMQIANNFLEKSDLSRTRFLHTFLPITKFREVDTRTICERIWSDFPHVQTVVPRLNDEGALDSCLLTAETELSANKWGISEPHDCRRVEPNQIDVVLVPGLCFDVNGHRVGYGKGFYDRFLITTRNDCRKIGLSYFEPIDEIDDLHEGDIPVDSVVTPLEG